MPLTQSEVKQVEGIPAGLSRLQTDHKNSTPAYAYEYVNVTFPSVAHQELSIATKLRPSDPENIEYAVVGFYSKLTPSYAPIIYKDVSTTKRPWQAGEVILKCSVPSVSCILLLTIPRDTITLPVVRNNWGIKPFCSVFNNAAQAIVSGSIVQFLTFNSEDYDPFNMHDTVVNPTRITVPPDGGGQYHVHGKTRFEASGAGTQYGLFIYLNGALLKAMLTATTNPALADYAIYSDAFNIVPGDYFELAAYQDSGGNLNAGTANRFSASEFVVQHIGY